MKLQSRSKAALAVGVLVAALALLYFPFRVYVLEPYQMQREAMKLPGLPAGITVADMGVPEPALGFECAPVPPGLASADLDALLTSLSAQVEQTPIDLCAGNRFRETVRHRDLRSGHFAIRLSSLPPELAAIARDPNSEPPEPARTGRSMPEEMEPAKLFHNLLSKPGGDLPETELQLGLAYVDLMTSQGGRENKARLSSRSIHALSVALDRRPYMLPALYARGLNYLYWPVIAGKLPLAIQDFKTCIALANLPPLRDHPPLVIAEAYRALGDSLVKLADSALSRREEQVLLRSARRWWQEGAGRFPQSRELSERLNIDPKDLPAYIDSARGLETYINTDLNLLWTR
jgi:hypothetical protein